MRRVRCAIYTRKSTEEGLGQEFNALDAQREACEAYVASQRHEGWELIDRVYDDGGTSCGHLDWPALQRLMACGVLPGIWSPVKTGPLIREVQRHLAQWTLQPIAGLMAEEVSRKLRSTVTMDVTRSLQAFDAGGRARAAKQIVDTLAAAKEAGVDPETALRLVDWAE